MKTLLETLTIKIVKTAHFHNISSKTNINQQEDLTTYSHLQTESNKRKNSDATIPSYVRVIQWCPFLFFAFFNIAQSGLAVVITLNRARVSFWGCGSSSHLQVRGRRAAWCLTAKELDGQPLKSEISVQNTDHTTLTTKMYLKFNLC